VDVGAPSVAPSTHATRAGAYGEGDVVADGTHADSSVAALSQPLNGLQPLLVVVM